MPVIISIRFIDFGISHPGPDLNPSNVDLVVDRPLSQFVFVCGCVGGGGVLTDPGAMSRPMNNPSFFEHMSAALKLRVFLSPDRDW